MGVFTYPSKIIAKIIGINIDLFIDVKFLCLDIIILKFYENCEHIIKLKIIFIFSLKI